MTKEFTKTAGGIIVPTQHRPNVPCAYCPKVIYKDEESNGRLFMFDGRPICAVCRIRRTASFRYTMKREGERATLADNDAREQDIADKNAEQVAIESQVNTQAVKIIKS